MSKKATIRAELDKIVDTMLDTIVTVYSMDTPHATATWLEDGTTIRIEINTVVAIHGGAS